MPDLPYELIDRVLITLANSGGEPKLAFKLASQLRRWHIQARLLHLVISDEFGQTMDGASSLGYVRLLELHVESARKLRYSALAMNLASENGHIAVLEWWRSRSGLTLKYSSDAMDLASMNGQVVSLEWWKASGLELRWTRKALDWASKRNQVAVLEWWKSKSGMQLKWSKRAMDFASERGHVGTLEWWKESSGLSPLKWSESALDEASRNGHVEVLEWWKESELHPLMWSENAIIWASMNGHVEVVEWWWKCGEDKKWNEDAIWLAATNEHARMLEWWEVELGQVAVDMAIENGTSQAQDWWRKYKKDRENQEGLQAIKDEINKSPASLPNESAKLPGRMEGLSLMGGSDKMALGALMFPTNFNFSSIELFSATPAAVDTKGQRRVYGGRGGSKSKGRSPNQKVRREGQEDRSFGSGVAADMHGRVDSKRVRSVSDEQGGGIDLEQ